MPTIFLPLKLTVPLSAFRIPVINLRRVVFPAPFGPIKPTISSRLIPKLTSLTAFNPPKLLETCSRTIMGQSNPDEDVAPTTRTLPIHTVMDSGRPLLVVPYAGTFATVGKRVLVAWNGGREASRAVHDALPILEGAELVSVLSINPKGEDHFPGFDISVELARHGVKTEALRTVSGYVSVGDLLLSEAADLSVDMIVMGAYGHSRLREFILGGASQQLMDSMTVPVFMSH